MWPSTREGAQQLPHLPEHQERPDHEARREERPPGDPRGEAGERQVKNAKIGLTHNLGGSGGSVVVHILEVMEE